MKTLLSVTISILGLAVLGFLFPVYAQDFSVETTRTYTVDSKEEVLVTETRKVTNNSNSSLISGNNNEIFQIVVISGNNDRLEDSFLSAEAYVNGQIVQFEKGNMSEDSIEIVVPYNTAVGTGETRTFDVRYTNYGLSEQNGALLDIFAPGFSDNFQFQTNNTVFTFKTRVLVAKNLGEINFAVPNSKLKSTNPVYYEYSFPQESLIGTNIWVQIGTTQYFGFTLTQHVTASETVNKGYYNEYNLVIPRDIIESEVTQKVYFNTFNPPPKHVIQDEEGNLIATFKILSSEDAIITITGFAEVSKTGFDVTTENSGTLSQIDSYTYARYLAPAAYWEVDAPEIQQLANELKGTETNVYEILEIDYDHIVDTIDYSEVKRFGINERQGALKTLQGGAAVCMEYSDLYLSVARAQGIPTRAAFGFGYDPRLGEDEQEAHQWVQSYIPEQDKWISIDVTWGESGPALIGGDLNHFYTHVAVTDPDTPPSVQRTSYGNKTELSAPEFEISALESISEGLDLADTGSVLSTFIPDDENKLEEVVGNATLFIQTANIPPSVAQNAQYVVYAGLGLIALAGVLIVKLVWDLVRNRSRKSRIKNYKEAVNPPNTQ